MRFFSSFNPAVQRRPERVERQAFVTDMDFVLAVLLARCIGSTATLERVERQARVTDIAFECFSIGLVACLQIPILVWRLRTRGTSAVTDMACTSLHFNSDLSAWNICN